MKTIIPRDNRPLYAYLADLVSEGYKQFKWQVVKGKPVLVAYK